MADTGAARSLVDPRLVRQLDLQEAGTDWIVGIGTEAFQVSLVSIDGGAIGRCPLSSFQAGIIDLAKLRIGVQLILGINAFGGYRLQFDLAKGRLYLLSSLH